MDKFLNLLDDIILDLCDKSATIIYEKEKNKEMYNCFPNIDLLKVFKKAFKELFLCELDLEKIKEQYALIDLNVNFHELDETSEKSDEIFEEQFNSDYSNIVYLGAVKDIEFHISKCEKDNQNKMYIILKENMNLIVYYVNIYNYLIDYVYEDNKEDLEFDFRIVLHELSKNNINTKDKYDVIKSFVKRLKTKKSDEILFVDERLEEYYKNVFNEINKIKNKEELYLSKDLLITLGASESLINEILYFQDKQNKEEKEINISIDTLTEYKEKNERKKILIEQLKEYIDLKDMHLKRFLNRKDMNLVLSILKELEYEKEEIKKVIFDNDLLYVKVDLLTKCEYIIDRAKFYASKYGFEKEKDEFIECYNLYLESDEEEKEIYIEFLSNAYDEIIKYLNIIPRTYEYEFSLDNTNTKLILKKTKSAVEI